MGATEIRRCAFCKSPATMISDSPKQRLYECKDTAEVGCYAVEVITKGKVSWWYHGWQRPDGSAIGGDGQRKQLGTYGWWDKRPESCV